MNREAEYCCRWMRADFERCEDHRDPASRFECSHAHIYLDERGRHSLIAKREPPVTQRIIHCPWCGGALHDGSVEARVDTDFGFVRDIRPHLERAPRDLIVEAARAQWWGAPAYPLLELAAEADPGLAAALAEIEEDGELREQGAWEIDPLEADFWLSREHPDLSDLIRTPPRLTLADWEYDR